MTLSTTTFLEFERAGWRDPSLCENYDARLSTVTVQCIEAYRRGAGYEVPMPAVVAAATRP
jgi:hypothetical protein